jgi:organic hydroperoxide reductase OsmC/OhrA
MKPFPHRYDTQLTGKPAGHATVSSPGLPPLETAPPVEFGGPGDAWSPEHLFLAAIQACYLFTFRAVARASNVAYAALDVGASGVVDRKERTTAFTEVVLTARLTVARDSDPEPALRALRKAADACLVSASISTPIRIEPEVVAADTTEPVTGTRQVA